MSTTYTPSLNLGIPGVADREYNLVIDPNWSVLDGMAALGPLAVTTNTSPSVSAAVKVAAGTFRTSTGTEVSYAGTTGFAVTTSTTTKLWLTEAGTLTSGSSYPSGHILKLATVTADTSTVTDIVDDRRVFSIGGLSHMPSRTVTATTDAPTIADGLILADATSNVIAFTLPTLTASDAGFPLVIFKTDASANAVTVTVVSGATTSLVNKYDAVHVIWSGTEWERIVGPNAVTPLMVRANELPSTSLRVRVAAGTFRATDGTDVTYAGTTALAVTTATNTMVWLTDAGVIATGAAYPTGPIVRLATVTAGATTVTSITDDRRIYSATGGLPRNATRTVTAATDTPTIADRTIYADATTAAIAFTLPTLTTADKGTPLKIIKTDAVAHNVTVGTISGGNATLTTQYAFVIVEWSGTAWFKFSA